MEIAVAGYQMAVTENISTNFEKLIAAVDEAAEQGAEILLTPEGSLSGYTHQFDIFAVEQSLDWLAHHAREKRLGLALGTCFVEADGKCYNQVRFYRPDGAYLSFHSKILRCGSLEEPPVGEINHYAARDLRTFSWREDLTIGGLICNDLWANPECTPMPDPHLTQQLSRMGARLIFHAVNGGRNGSEWSRLAWSYHESNLRMRARAAATWIITVDSAAPEHLPCSAPSGVIDPRGEWVCRTAAVGEDLFVYRIKI
jgi:predicted amidohydrolase